MQLFLGIDGGGTGCRAAVADARGRILGRGKAGPANIVTDPDGARANILAATVAALGSHGSP
ncbi:MAG: ATPase, partial [Paracoccaceae bacterium]|nr:ATPase [Paracoccaceae bacterium]